MSVAPMPEQEYKNAENPSQQPIMIPSQQPIIIPQQNYQPEQQLGLQQQGQLQNQIPYTGIPVNPPEFHTVVHQVNLTDMVMQYFNIPDQIHFEHYFERKSPCWTGRWARTSIFNIPGLGTLSYGEEFERICHWTWAMVPKKLRRKQLRADIRGCCSVNSHYFDAPDYMIDNGLIEMEFWNKMGIVTATGVPILKYQCARPNFYDVVDGHCGMSYPKVSVHFLLDQEKFPLLIIPEPSPCPETIIASCPMYALCGLCQSTREFTVEGLTQGVCKITNTRTCSDACAKVCLCQGTCGCPDVDYPHFDVQFLNVLPIDKLGILLGLVHYNIIKKWYSLAVIQRKVVGLA